MGTFTVRIVNSTFQSATAVESLMQPEEALAIGVRGGIAMISDEVQQGAATAAVEVTVEDHAGQPVRRVAVSLSVAPLFTG